MQLHGSARLGHAQCTRNTCTRVCVAVDQRRPVFYGRNVAFFSKNNAEVTDLGSSRMALLKTVESLQLSDSVEVFCNLLGKKMICIVFS